MSLEADAAPVVRRFWHLFVNRADTYCLQGNDGRYRRLRQALTDDVLAGHLAGDVTLAVDSMGADGLARWGVCDSDADDGLVVLAQVQLVCVRWGLVTWLEQSRRGGHLWLPCATPQPAGALRRLLSAACEAVGISMEVYPNRDGAARPGSVTQPVRLPLGVHRAVGRRYPFVDAMGRPLHRAGATHMLAWLLAQPVNHTAQLQSALHALGDALDPPQDVAMGTLNPPAASATLALLAAGRHLPKQGGAKWGIIAWVNRLVLLDLMRRTRSDVALRQTGAGWAGWCPFHDDSEGADAVPSLYVWCDPVYGWHWKCLATHCGAHQGKAKDPFDWLVWCSGGQWNVALGWGRALQESGAIHE